MKIHLDSFSFSTSGVLECGHRYTKAGHRFYIKVKESIENSVVEIISSHTGETPGRYDIDVVL